MTNVRDYAVSIPHLVENATYQESYTAFEPLAKQALSLGWTMDYGSQSISKAGVKASDNTPLGLEPIGQDCESHSGLVQVGHDVNMFHRGPCDDQLELI